LSEGETAEERRQRQERSARYVIHPSIFGIYPSGAKLAAPAQKVMFELNVGYVDGIALARSRLETIVRNANGTLAWVKSRYFVFAQLTEEQLLGIVRDDATQSAGRRLIHKVWPDRKIGALSAQAPLRTIKADACRRSFGGEGEGIVWVVLDSGIDKTHPHFSTYFTLGRAAISSAATDREIWVAKQHESFIDRDPLVDPFGHGTHVAGIIAGQTPTQKQLRANTAVNATPGDPIAASVYFEMRRVDERARIRPHTLREPILGVAPRCKLISFQVLDEAGKADESAMLAALDRVAEINADGRLLLIHGVNISIGCSFEAEWYAAGQSPLCVAVNRLVRMGVVVVAAAGNAGTSILGTEGAGVQRVGLDQSICDPGNAELAITVGSTHADAPHTYGVSYFSSRGPTLDGRNKPDLVAPGEHILSCASVETAQAIFTEDEFAGEAGADAYDAATIYYREDNGTSSAAPHVSGAAAAFLSIHPEFAGQPERVKEIFLGSATDLKRKREFQGAGLIDLMRAVQSV